MAGCFRKNTRVDRAVKKPSFIVEDYIPVNKFSRTGHARPDTLWIDMHWTGNGGQSAYGVREYFAGLAGQDSDDDERDIYAGSNFVIDYAEDITLEIIPVHEVSYTAGGKMYTDWARDMMTHNFTSNAPTTMDEYGWHGHTPNWLCVSIEMCHPDDTGKFFGVTLGMAAQVCAWLISFYNLVGTSTIITHHLITGKLCPKWWVERPRELDIFRQQVSAVMELNE